MISLSPSRLLLGLLLLGISTFWLSLGSGTIELESDEIWRALSGAAPDLHRSLILELRLPRTLAAFATGGLLAMAGTLMQVLLRNPLADPFILGTSGGAAVGALTLIMLGVPTIWIEVGAFAGALASTLLVFGLAHGPGQWNSTRLLLTGVVIAAAWGAVISFLLAISPNSTLRGMLFWLMGDLSAASRPWLALSVLGLGLICGLAISRHLNVLSRGDQQAAALGVAVTRIRIIIYTLAALLTASAVSLAGSIAFVGLIVPHMLRLAGARDHRILLPASVLLGGTLLMLTDTAARTLLAPRQLPVGVITALIGAPLFLFLLQRSANRGRHS